MTRLRIFGSHLAPRAKRVYRAVALFYLAAFAAVVWPVYALVGTARPIVLGLPLSLFSLVCLVLISFVVQLLLFRWEVRRDALEPPAIELSAGDRPGAGRPQEDECPPG